MHESRGQVAFATILIVPTRLATVGRFEVAVVLFLLLDFVLQLRTVTRLSKAILEIQFRNYL